MFGSKTAVEGEITLKPVYAVSALLIVVLLSPLSLFAQESGGESVEMPAEPVESTSDQTPDLAPGEVLDITTASDYFDSVSERYSEIEDYQANIVITQADSIMYAVLSHKRPDMLLIEFEDPEDLVISVDGVHLQIYIPYLNVTLDQPLKPHDATGIGLASGTTNQGLQLMKTRYSIAYLDSQDYVPIDEGSEELVRKLKLEWKSIDEGFRELVLSVDDDLLIRRIEGITAGLDELEIEFSDVMINPGFSNQKFVWDSPPSANMIYDFIFEPEAVEE